MTQTSTTRAPQQPRRNDGKTYSRSDRGVSLPAYFTELRRLPVLQRGEEFALAHELRECELELWCSVLGHPPLAGELLALLRRELPDRDRVPALSRLESLVPAPEPDAPAYRQRYVAAARAAAADLRAVDPDRTLVVSALEHLQRTVAARGGSAARGHLRGVDRRDRAARDARDRFALMNLRLVVQIARTYAQQHLLEELIQEGNVGLLKAVGRFDPERGLRFSTYASWWIRHCMNRALVNRQRMVRVPVHRVAKGRSLLHEATRLVAALGRPPTHEELGRHTGDPADEVARTLQDYGTRIVSLDAPVDDELGGSHVELIPDPRNLDRDLDHAIDQSRLLEAIDTGLNHLPRMERDILQQRFGLGGRPRLTLREIGAQHDLSRERIRQIQQRALRLVRRDVERQLAS